jgi:hypothetical protein
LTILGISGENIHNIGILGISKFISGIFGVALILGSFISNTLKLDIEKLVKKDLLLRALSPISRLLSLPFL